MIYLFWFLQAVIEESQSNAPFALGEKKIHAWKKRNKHTKEDTALFDSDRTGDLVQ